MISTREYKEKPENNRITIIIPLYNTSVKVFQKCLESIKIQTFQDIDILVINDDSTINYNDVIKMYQQFLKLNVIKFDYNQGPGVARRVGLEKATGKYIMFMDSDDELLEKDSLKKLMEAKNKNPEVKMVAGLVKEQLKNGQEILKNFNYIWVFGKLFERKFLLENDITFCDLRANEDNAFMTLFRLIVEVNDYKVFWLEEPVYRWRYEPNSITRRNNHIYYFKSIEDYVKAMLWVYQECIKRNIDRTNASLNHFCRVWIRLYFNCYEVLYDRDYYDANLLAGWCYNFYENCYKYLESEIGQEKFEENYKIMANESIKTFTDRVCNISYPDFYNIISSGNPLIES